MLPQRTVPEITRTPCEEATISPSVNSATEAPIIVLTKRGYIPLLTPKADKYNPITLIFVPTSYKLVVAF